MHLEQDIMMVQQLPQAQPFNSFTNTVGSDTITLSGSGTIASANVGPKGVTIGTRSHHPNYTLGNATLTVTQKPLNLFGSRIAGGIGGRDVQASELSFVNLVKVRR